MTALDQPFKISASKNGSGWFAVHVAVDHYLNPNPELNENKDICLTLEMISDVEIDHGIDELIGKLESMRIRAKRKLKALTESQA